MTWLVHPTITITVIVLLLGWWLGVLVTTVNSRREDRDPVTSRAGLVRDRTQS